MAEYKTTVTETEDGGRTITSGNMTEQEAAKLAAERERTKNMNTSDSASAASDALDKDIAAKKRYTEMQNILASGKHKNMSDEEKEAFVKEYKKLKLDYSFAEGGAVPMNEMSQQMEMFDDGGLMDEGGTVDPVSGNDVPPGSTQEEVRDDIPAQLSEGEFVFPADVVRYFGLEKLMEMRQEAKMGLQRMDDMGQMGNSEEAIMPDNLPFDIDDIDMEDDEGPQEFNLGGIVQQPGTGISGYTAPSMPTTGYTPPPVGVAVAPVVPGSQPQVAFTPATASTNIPTFGQFVGTSGGRYDEMVTYVNDAGVVRQIPHVNGKPIYPVPEGFKRQEKPTDVTTDTPLVDTTTTTQQPQGDGGSDRDDSVSTGTGTAKVGSISDALKGLGNLFGTDDTPKGRSVGDIFKSAAETNDFYGGSKAFGFSNEELRGATFDQGAAQFGMVGLGGIVSGISKELGVTNFSLKDVGVAGFTGMNDALNSIGLVNRGQLMNNAQATLVGNTMAAAHAAAYKGQDPAAAIKEVLNSKQAIAIQDAAYNSIKNSWQEKSGFKGNLTDGAFAKEMRSRVSKANAVLKDLETGSTVSPSGKTVGTKVMSRDFSRPRKANGDYHMKPTNAYTKEGIALKNAQTSVSKQGSVLADRADAKAARDARNAQAKATSSARAKAAADAVTASSDDGNPGDANSYGGADDEMGDVGQGDGGRSTGEDTTSAASDNYDDDGWGDFNKGGLVSQMKRSGLASKK